MKPASLALCLLFVTVTSANAETLQLTVAPRSQDAFGRAIYRLWLPATDEPLRAIIVRQHGCGPGARRLGLEHADDLQWQALARKWNCALLGSQMWAPKEDCSTWTIPADGSEYAFLEALRRFAELSGRRELVKAPWCLWGHSGGAVWVCNMTYAHPDRVVATFPRSGGLSPIGREYARSRPFDADSRPQAFQVPILFCHGEKEHVTTSRFFKGIEGAHHTYRVGRRHGAPWAIVSHHDSDHENSNSRQIAIRFFGRMLEQRLSGQSLQPVKLAAGRWVHIESHEIRADAAQLRKDPEWSWLPTPALAQDFVELQTRGRLVDKSPPPAPHNVRVERVDGQLQLHWDAYADVESGIGRFEILKNQEPFAVVRGELDKRWNPERFFHSWNYSDQPLRGTETPPMSYALPAEQAGAKWSVRTVNQAGLPSPPASAKKTPGN